MIFIICKRGTPQDLHAAGWRIVGGMEGLHIPVGWHKTSHQRSGGNWKIIPHFPGWNKMELCRL